MLTTLVLACAAVVLAFVAALVWRRWGAPALVPSPSSDVPGVRSALVFERLSIRVDDEAVPDAELLDAITHALERVGAEPGSWRADREGTVELAGTMLDDAFLLTLGAVSPVRWQLHVYAQPLGGARYAAPPRTPSMRTVLSAIDHAVRAMPDNHVIGWQRRQDSYRGEPVFAETPVD